MSETETLPEPERLNKFLRLFPNGSTHAPGIGDYCNTCGRDGPCYCEPTIGEPGKQTPWQTLQRFKTDKELQTRLKFSSSGEDHTISQLLIVVAELEKEIARLRAGDLRDDEFQDLCHKVSTNGGPQKFCDGCEAYQTKLFGESPITVLRKERDEADRLVGATRRLCIAEKAVIQGRWDLLKAKVKALNSGYKASGDRENEMATQAFLDLIESTEQ